jgi:hypothetical protein
MANTKEKERLLVELDFRLRDYNKMKAVVKEEGNALVKKLEDLMGNDPSPEEAFPHMEEIVNLKLEIAKQGEELLNWIRSNGVEDYTPYDLTVELESCIGASTLPEFTMDNLEGFRKDLTNIEKTTQAVSRLKKGVLTQEYGIVGM